MRPSDPGGKGAANERANPYIVEVAVSGERLDVKLNRRIIEFHKAGHIDPRHGRRIVKDDRTFFRWCFSDLATARAFVEQFGGAVLQNSPQSEQDSSPETCI